MSTTTYQSNHTSKSFPRRNIRTLSTTNAMTNDRSRFPLKTNHFITPIPPIRESVSINSTNIKPPPLRLESLKTPRYRSNTTENAKSKSSQQTYTFSNPPRELQLNRRSSLRQRISSAPDENSPRSRLNQPKSSSANGSLTPRSHDDNIHRSIRSEQQKDSLNALLKQQEKSKVPKAVQRRRIVLLFHRSSPRQEQNPSPISNNNQIQSREQPITQTNQQTQVFPSSSIQAPQPFDNIEPEMADSMQLAAILANIQLQDDWNPTDVSPKQSQPTTLDPSRYEYVVANPSDTATFRLSPRTLKPDEELAARLRFSQHYRYEMRSSANAQIPPLMASIVTENNNTMRSGSDLEQIFTFKLNSTDANKKQTLRDDDDQPFDSTMDNELVQLCYDATLKRFYDPNTSKYYELTSA
jgi:hypothetical protein